MLTTLASVPVASEVVGQSELDCRTAAGVRDGRRLKGSKRIEVRSHSNRLIGVCRGSTERIHAVAAVRHRALRGHTLAAVGAAACSWSTAALAAAPSAEEHSSARGDRLRRPSKRNVLPVENVYLGARGLVWLVAPVSRMEGTQWTRNLVASKRQHLRPHVHDRNQSFLLRIARFAVVIVSRNCTYGFIHNNHSDLGSTNRAALLVIHLHQNRCGTSWRSGLMLGSSGHLELMRKFRYLSLQRQLCLSLCLSLACLFVLVREQHNIPKSTMYQWHKQDAEAHLPTDVLVDWCDEWHRHHLRAGIPPE